MLAKINNQKKFWSKDLVVFSKLLNKDLFNVIRVLFRCKVLEDIKNDFHKMTIQKSISFNLLHQQNRMTYSNSVKNFKKTNQNKKPREKNENHAASIFLFFVLFFPWKSKAPIAFHGDQPMTIPRGYASPTELKWLLPACSNFQFPVTTTRPQKTQPQQHHRRPPQKHHRNTTTKKTTTPTPLPQKQHDTTKHHKKTPPHHHKHTTPRPKHRHKNTKKQHHSFPP